MPYKCSCEFGSRLTASHEAVTVFIPFSKLTLHAFHISHLVVQNNNKTSVPSIHLCLTTEMLAVGITNWFLLQSN